ncbi:MAG: SpoIIE family protein phosphatase [Microcoleaceae cyanobacterium]
MGIEDLEQNFKAKIESLEQEVTRLQNEIKGFQAQTVLLESLVTIAQTSAEGGVIKAALQKTLDLSADLTCTEKGSLFLLEPSSGKIVDAILTRAEVKPEQRAKLIGSVLDKGLAGWVSDRHQVGLITDTENDDRWLTLPNQPYVVGSALAVPILKGKELLGILTLLHSRRNHFTEKTAELMEAIANQIALVLENVRLYGKLDTYSRALNNELEKGRQIQIDFLPYDIPKLTEWEIVACFYPAKQVAGDFYDAFTLPDNQIGLVIADVCDKGVGAALFMALFRSLIRIFSAQTKLEGNAADLLEENKPADGDWIGESMSTNLAHLNALQAVQLVNNYVAENHWQMSMFATLFFGVLDPETGLLSYINGGHEPLFILDKNGIKQTLNSTGPAVGMMPGSKFKVQQVRLEPGEILMGYTDGVTEAKCPEGKLFTDKRLRELVEQSTETASELIERIKTSLFNYMEDAPQFDDITMLAVHKKLKKMSIMEPLTLPGILDSLSEIRKYIVSAAKEAGLEKKASYNLCLAVDEIATNIITHGYDEAGLSGNIYVEAKTDEQSLTIYIEDTAMLYDPTKKETVKEETLKKSLEERVPGGLGVYLAMENVDEFKYERVGDRNRNILVVNIATI